jgi:hypothetical protein
MPLSQAFFMEYKSWLCLRLVICKASFARLKAKLNGIAEARGRSSR